MRIDIATRDGLAPSYVFRPEGPSLPVVRESFQRTPYPPSGDVHAGCD